MLEFPALAEDPSRPAMSQDQEATVMVGLQKGGVGKSTSVAHLGHALARLGCRVLLVDFAPNASLSTTILGVDIAAEDELLPSVLDLMAGREKRGAAADAILEAPGEWQPDSSRDWAGGGAWPGTEGRVYLIANGPGMQSAAEAIKDTAGAQLVLARALSGVARQFDLVLIDTDPTTGITAQMALHAAGWALAPVQSQPGAVDGLPAQLAMISEFANGWSHPLRFAGAFAVQYDRRQRSSLPMLTELWDTMQQQPVGDGATDRFEVDTPAGSVPGCTLFPEVIPHAAAVINSSFDRSPVTAMAGARARDIGNLYARIGLRLLALRSAPGLPEIMARVDQPDSPVWPPLVGRPWPMAMNAPQDQAGESTPETQAAGEGER